METGTYILLLYLPENETLTIGKLGTFEFTLGWYAYIGSAFGAGGLTGRLKHHLKPVDKPHWHIDYLRQAATLVEIWLSPDTVPHEQDWVEVVLAIPGALMSVDGFGASDSEAESHLFYFEVRPSLEDFWVALRPHFPDAKVVRALVQPPQETDGQLI
jgi:Uri superfamily endonuclease